MSSSRSIHMVAVVGGSGAGKGWFVERLCRLLGDKACHLQLDDFYRDLSHLPLHHRSQQNFDVPEAIDWAWAERVLRACRKGAPLAIPGYDFATHCRTAGCANWEPRPVVLIDGLWLLHPPEIRGLFDLKVFLDAPEEVRRTRRLARDVAERGYTRLAVEHQLREAVVPMHDRYVEPQKEWADLVLTQPFQTAELADFSDRFWRLLSNGAEVPRWECELLRAELTHSLTDHEYCT